MFQFVHKLNVVHRDKYGFKLNPVAINLYKPIRQHPPSSK